MLDIEDLWIVRPSSLDGWNDCARRAASRMYRRLIEDCGYSLRETDQNIGAAVGTAVHSGAALVLNEKIASGSMPSASDVEETAIISLREEVVNGVSYDATSTDLNTSEFQARRMAKSYLLEVAPKIEPDKVEERLMAKYGALTISGQKDVLARQGTNLRDLKTGVRQTAHAAQYGAYSLLEAAHGRQVERITEDFIPRVRKAIPQPPAEELDCDREAAERQAIATMEDIERSLEKFLSLINSGSAAPETAFRANPTSLLCSPKFCDAWGTEFCRIHKKGH